MVLAVLIAILSVVAVTLLCVALGIVRRMRSPQAASQEREEFSIQRYRPLERLLSHEDYDFLMASPPFGPKLAKRLHDERRRIVLQYLQLLRKDFHDLHRLARLALLNASEDRPGVALALFKEKLRFEHGCVMLRWRLATRGIAAVEARPLVQAIQSLYERLSVGSSGLELGSQAEAAL